MRDAVGYPLSGCKTPALDLLDRAGHEFRCFAGNPLATAEAALAAAPELVMAQVLRAWLLLLSTEAPAVPLAAQALAQARLLPRNERESLHLRAAELVCHGHWRAAGLVLEELSAAYPLDSLALQAGQQIDFFCGDTRMLRDRVLAVLPAWSDAVPGWHSVLGMLAFGLEENGDYARAERLGRQAVELEPRDAWAQHAVAHVLEMQGRRDEGIRWMEGNHGWQQDNFLATHNWWHLALHHLAHDNAAAVLKLYDGPIHGHRPTVVAELIDASALLWRTELRGHAVGERWDALATLWEPHAASGNYAFNDLHAAMAFARAGRDAALRDLFRSQEQALSRGDDNAGFTRDVGAPAVRAFVAFAQNDFARAVELLRPIRTRTNRFGGSHAQRDVIEQTLIEAAQRGGQAALARAWMTQRQSLAEQRRPGARLRP
jgi:tetratricopeptide (TPR) repeat protein